MVAFRRKLVLSFAAIFVIDFKSLTFTRNSVFIFTAGRWFSPATLYFFCYMPTHPLPHEQTSHNLLDVMQ